MDNFSITDDKIYSAIKSLFIAMLGVLFRVIIDYWVTLAQVCCYFELICHNSRVNTLISPTGVGIMVTTIFLVFHYYTGGMLQDNQLLV